MIGERRATMIERIGQAIVFEAFYTASKLGVAGLTVTVDVYDPAGSKIVSASATTALGGGWYYYTLASGSVTTAGRYRAIFTTATTTVDQRDIPALIWVGTSGVESFGAFTGTGVNTILGFLKALASKTATVPSDIGGTFDPATDSIEAIRDTAPMGTAMRGTDSALLASSYTAPDNASALTAATNSTTLLARLGAFTGTGVNTVLGFLKAALSKSATLPTDIGGTFTPTTDSTEALAEAAAAIAAKTALIGTATVTATASIVDDILTIQPGDSYGQAVGRAAHSIAMPGDWTGGGTATLQIGATEFAVTVGAYTSGTDTTALTCAMKASETLALDTAEQVYTWRAVKGTGATASKRSVYGTVVYGEPLAEPVTP
jgi:hypothetical protein